MLDLISSTGQIVFREPIAQEMQVRVEVDPLDSPDSGAGRSPSGVAAVEVELDNISNFRA